MKKDYLPYHKVSVSQLDEGKAIQIFERLCIDWELVVLNKDQPIAFVLSPEEYLRLAEIEEDYKQLIEADRRLEENGKKPMILFKEMLEKLKLSEEDLSKVSDPYI